MTQRFWSGSSIEKLEPHQIFVFGANPEFRHGAGAAKAALAFGATYGSGRGIVGQTYGLVTKNLTANFYEKETGITYRRYGECSVSPEQIKTNIAELYACARANPHLDFLITYQYLPNQQRSLNGYNSKEMLDMFTSMPVPDNVLFHDSYGPHLSAAATKTPNKKYTFFFHLTSVFSNFYPAAFVYKNVQFISNEQFMMYCKAKQFKDEATAKAILKVNDHPLAQQFLQGKLTSQQIVQHSSYADTWNQLMQGIKKLGRQVANYDDAVWSDKRKTAVCVGAVAAGASIGAAGAGAGAGAASFFVFACSLCFFSTFFSAFLVVALGAGTEAASTDGVATGVGVLWAEVANAAADKLSITAEIKIFLRIVLSISIGLQGLSFS